MQEYPRKPRKPRKMKKLTLKNLTGDIPDTDADLALVYGHYTLTRDPNHPYFILTSDTDDIDELLKEINKRVPEERLRLVRVRN
jgi:hypothetical protein